ncbi:MAG: glycosyltransferase family 39 protein [Cyanobacteria bacterium SZAS LIN-2]|nr:glycosyltransferase family 39 protein [Cyanobacteria bacterium SZAS LIN-2]
MRKLLTAPAIAFLAPALLSAYFTFGANDFNRGLVWDSAHYVLSAQSLLTWLVGCINHHYVSPATIDLGPSLMIDGPVLPAFGAVLIALGKLFHASAEVAILAGQSMICGLNSLLFFLIARRLVEPKAALAGALLLGFHPATIVSASQFLTEQLTQTSLLAFTLALILALPRGRLSDKQATSTLQYSAFFIAGSLATLILHLKTALFPTVAVLLLLALASKNEGRRQWKSRGKIVLALAAGFFITIVPWLIFSKLASGRITLAPNRVPSINLAVGLDLESDAWGVAPPTESVMPIIFAKPSAIAFSLIQARPLSIASLCLRKIERLFAYSWNDFCWSVFGLDIYWQCLLQRLILAAAALGMIYILVQEKLLSNDFKNLSNTNFLKVLTLLMVAGHFIFIPFETQPRYGYSALPYLILLALFGAQKQLRVRKFPGTYAALCVLLILLAGSDIYGPLFALCGNIDQAELMRNTILAVLAGLALNAGCCLAVEELHFNFNRQAAIAGLGTLITLAFLLARGYNSTPPEWSVNVAPGLQVERQVLLPPLLTSQWQANAWLKGTWAAVLIDGDENLASALIDVNGQQSTSAAAPLLDFEQDYAFQSTVKELAQMAARTRGDSPQSLRQWRLAPIPFTAIKLDGSANVVKITPLTKAVKIYGQYRLPATDKRDKKLMLPSLYGFSALRLSILGDPRTTDRLKRRVAQSTSHFSAQMGRDLAPDKPGEQAGDYRMYLILAAPAEDKPAAAADQQTSQPALTFKDHFWQIF